MLYSNNATQGGLSNQKIVLEMVHDGANVRVIDTTEAALFMNDDVFKQAAVRAHNMHTLADIDTRGTPLNDFFFHAKDGVWAEVSHRFADATVGNVRVLGGYGAFDRTFAQVELPALLANSNVTTIDGIDIEHIRSITGDRARFDVIKANAMMQMQMHFSDVSCR